MVEYYLQISWKSQSIAIERKHLIQALILLNPYQYVLYSPTSDGICPTAFPLVLFSVCISIYSRTGFLMPSKFLRILDKYFLQHSKNANQRKNDEAKRELYPISENLGLTSRYFRIPEQICKHITCRQPYRNMSIHSRNQKKSYPLWRWMSGFDFGHECPWPFLRYYKSLIAKGTWYLLPFQLLDSFRLRVTNFQNDFQICITKNGYSVALSQNDELIFVTLLKISKV